MKRTLLVVLDCGLLLLFGSQLLFVGSFAIFGNAKDRLLWPLMVLGAWCGAGAVGNLVAGRTLLPRSASTGPTIARALLALTVLSGALACFSYLEVIEPIKRWLLMPLASLVFVLPVGLLVLVIVSIFERRRRQPT